MTQTLTRRIVLASPALLLPRLAGAAPLDERAVGSAEAPVTVAEYFSMTCPHCARFARDTLPKIHSHLIAPGKLRYVYRDYPLDQVALLAAQVARSLPPERYEPFTLALLASQDRWAFARGVNSTEELAKMAALAGLSRAAFDAAVADQALRDAILAGQEAAEKRYRVDSTPSFVFDGPRGHDRVESGELPYEKFSGVVAEVAAA